MKLAYVAMFVGALFLVLLPLALAIHFVLLSTDHFNWLEGARR